MDENKKIYDGTCIFCDTPVALDTGYYTDGMISVCPVCASRKTLVDVVRAIDFSEFNSNLSHKFIPNCWAGSVRTECDDSPEPYDPKTPIDATGKVIYANNSEEADEYERKLMSLGHEVGEDIMSMSQDDFLSKYCDFPEAIDLYLELNPEA